MRAELSGQLEQAIAQMDPIDQEVLALRHFEELTNSEVAEVLGITESSVRSRLFRARNLMAELLNHSRSLR